MTPTDQAIKADLREIFDKIRHAVELPEKELLECMDRTDESIPVLMEILETESANGFVADDDHAVPYAMLLLGQLRHRPAYPLMQKLARHPQVEEFLGDLVTEALGRCLAACWDGDVAWLVDLAKDATVDENPRGQGVVALVCLAVAGVRTREETLVEIKDLLRVALETESSELASACVIALWDLFPDAESETLARAAYAKSLVDDDILPLADLDDVLAEGLESVWEASCEESLCSLSVDAVGDSKWWSCWSSEDDEWDESGDESTEGESWIPPEPIEQLKSDKVGRNDPCPCGSGAKYKKCCGKGA